MNRDKALELYKVIKNRDAIEDVCKKLDVSFEEVFGIVELLTFYNFPIELIEKNGTFYIKKGNGRLSSSNKSVKLAKEECKLIKLCVISDTHLCNKGQQLGLVNKVYRHAYENEYPVVLHVGDVLDGDYSDHRREHRYQLFLRGFDEQVGYVVDMYPEVLGIKTYYIQGSHDQTHLKNGGATPGIWIDKTRNDMIYLGQDEADITFDKMHIKMDHPGGGCAKYLSYKPQQAIESMSPNNKPNLFLQGHYHKEYYQLYRNVHAYLVPALVNQSDFMKKMNLANITGAYFMNIYVDDKGRIQYINANPYRIGQDEWRNDDYKKVRRLVIK